MLFIDTILKIIRAISISKFCFVFTLQQGTIMIAMTELSFSLFAVILLVLCHNHANELLNLITTDMKEFEDHILHQKGDDEPPPYAITNEEKMLDGQNLAEVVKMVVCVFLLSVIAYLMTCLLLIYGAIQKSPCHLLPWISIAFISLASMLLWFFLPFYSYIFENYRFLAYAFALVLYPIEIYSWLTVFSYYRQLTLKQFNKDDNPCRLCSINTLFVK